MAVYEEIYDIVAENLKQADRVFEYGKETFLCDVGTHPQEVDVSRLLNLPNPEFMEAAHVAVLKRLPDERRVTFWSSRYHLPEDEFREAVLKSLANSSVAAVNHIYLAENPYFAHKRGLKYHLIGILYGLTDKSSLRELGKKMPGPIQRMIRKVFL